MSKEKASGDESTIRTHSGCSGRVAKIEGLKHTGFKKREGIGLKAKSGKRGKRRKPQGFQAMSPTELSPASPQLVSPASFPTGLQPILPTLQVSSCLPTSSKEPCFSFLTSSYQYTEQSPWLWCSDQSPEVTLFSSQGLTGVCPAQSPEVQCPHPFSHHFTASQRTWHRAPPRTNTLPLPAFFKVFKDSQRPSSFPKPTSQPRPGELFSPKKGARRDLKPAARGGSWERMKRRPEPS